jgi:D-alanyl-lipoteichoic acid acyltransferase DltB (MBOAT superfamily)
VPRDPRRVDTAAPFYLIATGLFKKVVIANYLASHIVDQVFGAPGSTRRSRSDRDLRVRGPDLRRLLGYTDIAIGLALLLGFKFPQNFDSPYAAVSLQDFWRRWHMTLSRWLRDYLYIPLGGNRKGTIITYRNLMLTMLIGGLWHGAGWTFIVWGGIHGVGLVVEHWRSNAGLRRAGNTRRRRIIARVITFNIVCLAWVFFRADSFATAWDMLTGLFTGWGQGSPLVTGGVLLAIAVGIGSQYLPARFPIRVMDRFAPTGARPGCCAGVALMLTNTMGPEGVAPFIYFRF